MLINRLVLNNGVVFQPGAEWPDDPNFIIGMIKFVGEFSEVFEEEGAGATDSTPAHYEVWQATEPLMAQMFQGNLGEVLKLLEGIPELRRMRVWLSGNIGFDEEVWPGLMATDRMIDYFKEAIDEANLSNQSNGQSEVQQVEASASK